jgi:hypothetical protein
VVLTHKRDCGGDQFEAPSAVILTEQPVWRDILSDARGVLFAHLFETRPFCDGEARDKSKAAPQCAASTSTSAVLVPAVLVLVPAVLVLVLVY